MVRAAPIASSSEPPTLQGHLLTNHFVAAPTTSTDQRNLISYTKTHDFRVEAQPDSLPIVICPGFGNASKDYTAPFGVEQDAIVSALARRGFKAYVLPVERKDWFRVGRMVFTRAFWSQSCTTHPGYSWYLERLKETVDLARKECGTDKVDLVGHSAGGWLARAFLGQLDFKDDPLSSTEEDPQEGVRALISLGTPHTPPPPGTMRDMTGGALTFTNERWPGAYFATHPQERIKYVSVAGRSVVGDKEAGRQTLPGYSFGSYEQVAGIGHQVAGDGVVPLDSALLEGARHEVIDGVFHSTSRISTFDEPSGVVWYGSDDVVDLWLRHLVEE